MSNRTVQAAAEGMPSDERELLRIWHALSPAGRAKLLAYARQLLAEETAR